MTDFLIADTFTGSLARLTGQEQKAVKITAFDLQHDPANPGMQFHKLNKSRDPNFWSVRVNADLRLIVHKTPSSLMLCYAGHHDSAYAWAERRKIERHPVTGAAQLVELEIRVEQAPARPSAPILVPTPIKAPVFDGVPDNRLLGYGVPVEWLPAVRAATDETVLDIAEHLPQEAAEALLAVATGAAPPVPPVSPVRVAASISEAPSADLFIPPGVAPSAAPLLDPSTFLHPDAQRRFRVVANAKELERALDFPWEKWTVFLHPSQRQLVERDYAGPARISGSAGTGKTIVALHRAAFLARRNPGARVLLTTFSTALANALKVQLRHLVGNEPEITERITVGSIHDIGLDLYRERFGEPQMAPPELIRSLLVEAAKAVAPANRFTPRFLVGEWNDVVDARQLRGWEAYRNASRLGRKTRIGVKQREMLWAIFAQLRTDLAGRKMTTWPELFGRVGEQFDAEGTKPFGSAVVDEAQDIGIAELRFLSALVSRPGSLYFTGDLGQRIFQQPFSWKSMGIDIRGRSHTLRINYRTSHQIRMQADRLLPASLADVDGNVESRKGTISVFNGPPPVVAVFDDEGAEAAAVGAWIADRQKDGVLPQEIGIFVRDDQRIERAKAAVMAAAAPCITLGDTMEVTPGKIAIGTMHLAKGLEFRAVAVMACDDEVIPLQERIENVADDADLEEVYNTERHLLYVACTRARDHLLVTGVTPASEFLDDLKA
jgi:hypothetical protein